MAKGQKQLQEKADKRSDEQFATAAAAQKRLVDGSPEFQAKKAQVADRRKSVDEGTIADHSDFVHNRAFTSAQQRQREAKAGLAKSGVAGLAGNYADPTQIALAKQVIDDEWSRDAASTQEAEAANFISETNAMENDIINSEIQTDSNVMGSAFGVSQNQQQVAAQIAAQRASVLPSILGMALGAGAQIATSGASAWFKKPAMAGSHGG